MQLIMNRFACWRIMLTKTDKTLLNAGAALLYNLSLKTS